MTDSEALQALEAILAQYPSLAVAFSGGVDSAFLLKKAAQVLGGGKVTAITVRAANFPEREFREAVDFAKACGVRHEVLDWDFMSSAEAAANTPERCYFCKKALMGAILAAAAAQGHTQVADGANKDDDDDYRPGARAARELGVVSPLRQAGLRKAAIRGFLREMGVPLWNKPAFACLASRIPYGTPVSAEALGRIERAEQFLQDIGFRNVRVRHHGELARIEVEPDDRERFCRENLWERVDARFRELGYAYSALDLRGYRMGSMNETITVTPS